jgi:hypothetical protein
VDYDVDFQADVCLPHPGQIFKAPIKLRSKVGIHAETPPIKVLIPRDLHLGNSDFDSAQVGEEVEFEVIGAQFKQQDADIIIVGRLIAKIEADTEAPLLSQDTTTPVINNPVPKAADGEEKQVVITAPMEAEKPKKRKLKRGGDDITTNEQVLSF